MRRTLAILMPVRAEIEPETQYALKHHVEFADTLFLTSRERGVDVARTDLLIRLLALPQDEAPQYVAFIDSDSFWWEGSLSQAIRDLQTQSLFGANAFLGFVSSPRGPFMAARATDQRGEPIKYDSRARGTVIPATAFSFQMAVIEATTLFAAVQIFEKAGGDRRAMFDPGGVNEDIAFISRMSNVGVQIMVDPGLVAFHAEAGFVYAPGMPQLKLVGGILAPSGSNERLVVPTHRYGPAMDAVMDQMNVESGLDMEKVRCFFESHPKPITDEQWLRIRAGFQVRNRGSKTARPLA